MSAPDLEWLQKFSEKILRTEESFDIELMTLEEKFAFIFVINQASHQGNKEALTRKGLLQKNILSRHKNECRIEYVETGRYADTMAVSYGIWMTHIPIFLYQRFVDSPKIS